MTNLSNITTHLSAFSGVELIQKAYQDYKAKFVVEAKEELVKSFKDVFENYPEIESVNWRQYTPYFNDGDECVFQVTDCTFEVNGTEIEGSISKWSIEYNPELSKFVYLNPVLGSINKCINAGPFEDVLLEMFGNHAEVTVTKEGIQVDEYDHE